MDQNLFVVQTIFTALAAIAIILQAAILFALYRAVSATQKAILDVLPKVEAMTEKTTALLPKTEQVLETTLARLDESREILASAKAQLGKIEVVVDDATTRARAQMDRVEMVLDDTMDKAQQAVNAVSRGVTRPIREIQGVAAGLSAAFTYLLRSARPSVDRATSDEEMFI